VEGQGGAVGWKIQQSKAPRIWTDIDGDEDPVERSNSQNEEVCVVRKEGKLEDRTRGRKL